MFEFLNQGWVGSSIGILGILIGFLLFHKSLRLPQPRISFESDHALTWSGNDPLPTGIEIRFHGKSVPRLSRSFIRIWNAGSACLSKEMIADHDPLRFAVNDGGEILGAVVIKQSTDASMCSVTVDPAHPSEAAFSFEFLNPNDGCVLAILHSGPKPSPTLLGTVKGHHFRIVEGPMRKPVKGPVRWLRPLILWTGIAIGFAMIVLANQNVEQLNALQGFFTYPPDACQRAEPSLAFRISGSFVGSSYIGFGFWQLWRRRRSYPKSLKSLS